MSWFSIALDIAHLSLAYEHSKKLDNLQKQGAKRALIEAAIKELRDQIFHFNQATESVINIREENPRRAAIMMKIVEKNLDESFIHPDLFSEISDKEYVASTIRWVRESSYQMLSAFPAREQALINATADAACKLPDYQFYLDNYEDGKSLRMALETIQGKGSSYGCFVKSGIFLMIVPGCMLVGLPSAMIGDANESIATFLAFGLIALWIWLFWTLVKSSSNYTYAKTIVEDIRDGFEVDRFLTLDDKFKSDTSKVEKLKQQAEKTIKHGFGGLDWPSLIEQNQPNINES